MEYSKKPRRRIVKHRLILAVLIFAAFIFLVCLFAVRTGIKLIYPVKYEDAVEKYSSEYGVDKTLVLAVIKTESSFDPNAESEAGALGLMQLLPDTFDWLQTKTGEKLETNELLKPEVSIKYGTYFLGILKEKFGEDETVIAAYHAGINRVAGWLTDSKYSSDGKTLDNIPYNDTRHYVSKVMNAKNIYYNFYKMKG